VLKIGRCRDLGDMRSARSSSVNKREEA